MSYKTVKCDDPECPDYGKTIEVFDGEYQGLLFHVERVNGYLYNVQIDGKHGRHGLTHSELEEFVDRYL